MLYTLCMTEMGTRLSGRDRALSYLRDMVLADPAMQGSFVNEQQIATRVGVSRTPVREALLILASEGLVQMLPQRGAYISTMSGREISELMDLRGLIERHAAGRAIILAAEPFTSMDAILAAQVSMSSAPDQHDAKDFIELDRQFHQEMVDAAASQLLSRTYAGLRERQIRVGISALLRGAQRWTAVCEEHGAIVAALRAADVTAAHEAIDFHLATTLRALLAA